MKLAFHFDGDHSELGNAYGQAARRLVFSALLGQRRAHVSSKIFVGDLLFGNIDHVARRPVSQFLPRQP